MLSDIELMAVGKGHTKDVDNFGMNQSDDPQLYENG